MKGWLDAFWLARHDPRDKMSGTPAGFRKFSKFQFYSETNHSFRIKLKLRIVSEQTLLNKIQKACGTAPAAQVVFRQNAADSTRTPRPPWRRLRTVRTCMGVKLDSNWLKDFVAMLQRWIMQFC